MYLIVVMPATVVVLILETILMQRLAIDRLDLPTMEKQGYLSARAVMWASEQLALSMALTLTGPLEIRAQDSLR